MNAPSPEVKVGTTAADRMIAAALGLSFAAVTIGANGYGITNPPVFNGSWGPTWLLSLVGLSTALAAMLLPHHAEHRVLAGIAYWLSLVALWPSLLGYYGTFHDYPWMLVIAIGSIAIIGGFWLRFRVLAGLVISFYGFWFWGALILPKTSIPAVLTEKGIQCTLLEGQEFELKSVSGVPLNQLIDFQAMEIRARTGAIICHETTRPFPVRPQGPGFGPEADLAIFKARVFAPSWIRSYDLEIVVPQVVGSPCVIKVALDNLPSRELAASAGKYRLSASRLEWGMAKSVLPSVRCLKASVTYNGFSYSGSRGYEIRIVDDEGRILGQYGNLTIGHDGGATQSLEIVGVRPDAKFLRFELISEAQAQHDQVVFHFSKVPNRSDSVLHH